jgi:hypothetical protein
MRKGKTADDMERIKQTKSVNVERGLLLVRYASADNENLPPKVRVVVGPRHQRDIELVLNPDHDDAVLWQPGNCLVVRASKPGQLVVEVIPTAKGSTAATVQIEALSQGKASVAGLGQSMAEVDFGRFSLLAHVAGAGDVQVGADEWVAGPDAPARIEGLSIDWPDRPDNLDVSYAVKLARPHAASGRMTKLGGYAGTRGRALPVVGVTVELRGPAAADFQLSAEAAFLGAPLTRMSGKRIAISGPTGREPLVGFRIRLDEIAAPLPATPARMSSRVRIFRSQADQRRTPSALESFCDSYSEAGTVDRL